MFVYVNNYLFNIQISDRAKSLFKMFHFYIFLFICIF